MAKVTLNFRERAIIAHALKCFLRSPEVDPKILYRAGRILDTIKDDEREEYYSNLSAKYRKLEAEWVDGGSTSLQPRPSKQELNGTSEEYTLLDVDFMMIKEALSKPGWWIGEDGKSLEDPRVCKALAEKFGLGD